MREIYPHATRWQVFKYKIARFFSQVVKGTLILATLFGMVMFGRYAFPNTIHATQEYPVEVDNLGPKVKELKANVLAELKKCETGARTELDAPILLDSNNKMSIGLYMFQIDTVVHYSKTLYNEDISRKKAVEIALSEVQASQMAEDIIFETKNGIRNWANCDDKLGLSSKVNFIKQLEN